MDPAKPVSREEAQSLLAPLAGFPRVALAVSGGPDSLALMQLAARWCAERGERPELSVLTVDHDLRPASRDEAVMVGRVADALGLPHTILTWVDHGAKDSSLQARARVARYDLMAAHAHAHGIPALVTAHHLDDQAETFLMRLKRGSGLDGLSAIPEQGSWAGITLLRPLLDLPKARLVATLEEEGLPFATDPSNADVRFERVRMRQSTPALAKFGLTPEAVALSARRLRRARAALDIAAQDFLASHAETSEAGYAVVDCVALSSAPEEIVLRALSRLIAAVGGGGDPVRLAKLEVLLAALKENADKAQTLARCCLESHDGGLFIFRELRKAGLPELTLQPGERSIWDNRFTIELGPAAPVAVTVRALGEEGLQRLKELEAMPPSLPRLVARTLPACWQGEMLLGLPELGGPQSLGDAPRSRHERSLDCRAIFLRGTV